MHAYRLNRWKKLFFRVVLPLVIALSGLLLAIKYGASIWLNSQRSELEQTISRATGLQTRIAGSVSATLWPTPGIALGDISLSRDNKPVLTARELTASFALKPLFDKQFVPGAFDINQLELHLPTNENGQPIFALPIQPSTTGTPDIASGFQFKLPDRIELHNSSITAGADNGEPTYYIKGLNLAMHPLWRKDLILKALTEGGTENWGLAIYVNFEKARIRQLALGQTQLNIQYQPGQLAAGITEVSVFGGKGQGTFSWLRGVAEPEYRTSFTLHDFDASQSVKLFRPESFIKGRLNMSADFASSGSDLKTLINHASGNVNLSGAELDLVTTNLDELVTRIISAKQYNLTDAAAYFFIGPLGASATKGLDIANVARELMQPGTTPNQIKRMASNWEVTDGIATAKDVALETGRYRLALKGRIHLVKQEFENVEIAVVDDRGCAVVTQRLNGPIASPSIEKTNLLLTLTKPFLDALAKTAKRVASGNCKPFYSGELLPERPAAVTPEETGADADTGLPEVSSQ